MTEALSSRAQLCSLPAAMAVSEEETAEETVKGVIVRESLKFVTDLLVVTVIETLIVQSTYVSTLKVFKVMVLLPEIAEVVLEEHEPP